jgi:N6-L-threonylcarbamoyladenine synthase
MALCADNAAMLGVAGDFYLQRGDHGRLDLNALASWPLDRVGKQDV